MGSQPSRLSASRVAAVLGFSKWSTPFDAWRKIIEEEKPGILERLGIDPPERTENAAMIFGLAFEDAICRLVEELGEKKVYDREAFYEHESQPYISAHIDGRIGPLTLIENKTTNIRSWRDGWGEPGSEQIPENYMLQIQQQMACTGADECIVNVLVFPRMADEFEAAGAEIVQQENGMSMNFDPWQWSDTLVEMGFFHSYPIKRNDDLISLMLEKTAAWWAEYIEGEKIPPAACYKDIQVMLTNPCGTMVATKDMERICALDKALADEIKSATEKRAEYKTLIGQFMKDNLEGAPIDAESRAKVMLMSRDGHKLRSFSKKGGFR